MTGQSMVLPQLRSILLMHGRTNTDSKWWTGLAVVWGALFAGIVVLAGFLVWMRAPLKEWTHFASLPLLGMVTSTVVLVCMVLVAVAMGLIQQFRPSHAALVPHLRTRLPQAATLYCASLVTLTGLLAARFLPDIRPVLAGLGALGVLLGMVTGARMAMAMIVLFVGVFGSFVANPVAEQWTATVKDALAAPAVGIPAGLAVLLAAMYWTFALRGDKHIDIGKRMSSIQWATTNNANAVQPLARSTSLAFQRYLAWRLQSKAPTGRSHLVLALGPSYHWVSALIFVLLVNVFIVGLLLVLRVVVEEQRIAYWSTMIAVQAAAMQVFHVLLFHSQARTALHKTRAEQSLLALAERAPALAEQSRRLIPHLLRQYLIVWSATTAMIVGLGWWTQSAVLELHLVLCMMFALLPSSAFLIRKFAVDDNVQGPAGLKHGMVPMFAITAALVLVAIFAHIHFFSAWCLGMAGLTAVLWYACWNRVMRSGALMLPVGRAG